MLLTVLLAVLDAIAIPSYALLVLADIRPGFRLSTLGMILGAFSGAMVLGIESIQLALFLLLCITATAVVFSKGRPASLFDWSMIYGPKDPEATEHDRTLGNRQLLYLLIVLAEGAPAIVYVQR
jgi:hypothetical protein